MMPKTTQNLSKDYFSNIIQKTILFLPSFFEKKVWLLPFKISHIFLPVFNSSNSFTKSVISIHQVEKNRKIKSAPPEEKYYILYISIY
ncbi:hypothetical protein CLU82_4223 [Flavobacterium sp. 5]|nr:hypothetical protein CLU82_4223 [Flavobacterium sp. 5]